MCCYQSSDPNKADAVVFKIWNESFADLPEVDRDVEVATMQVCTDTFVVFMD